MSASTPPGLQDDPDGEDVSDIEETSCEDPHDAEVLARVELTEAEADDFEDDPGEMCDFLVADAGFDPEVVRDDGLLVPVLDGVSADEGDVLVCAIAADGGPFEEPYDPDE